MFASERMIRQRIESYRRRDREKPKNDDWSGMGICWTKMLNTKGMLLSLPLSPEQLKDAAAVAGRHKH